MLNFLNIKTLNGSAIGEHLNALAQLRMSVFREWPYLYEGNMHYEAMYLQRYADCADSISMLCFDGDTLVAASTALPLEHAETEMQKPMISAGYSVDEFLYYGESLILRPYRGQGLGGHFFKLRENHGIHLSKKNACFCAVERHADDPRKPLNYRGNEAFWRRHHYRPTEIMCHFDWPDVGTDENSTKPLRFWIKELNQQ